MIHKNEFIFQINLIIIKISIKNNDRFLVANFQ